MSPFSSREVTHTPGPGFTPGPWIQHGVDVGARDQYGFAIVATAREAIGINPEANARLISTAPEMRAELREGAELAQAVVNNWERGDLAGAVNDLHDWIADAFALLARAEGRTP